MGIKLCHDQDPKQTTDNNLYPVNVLTHMERIHHVEVAVLNGEAFVNRFRSHYGFNVIAKRSCLYNKQWVLQSGKAIFVVSEFCCTHLEKSYATPQRENIDPYYLPQKDNDIISKNLETVFNIALKVPDVKLALAKAKAGGAVVCKETSVIKDDGGSIEYAVINSCLGNVIHTLIDDSQYSGKFLPLFVPVCDEHQNSLVTYIDHVAFVCNRGSTSDILQWYEKCFAMNRFLINSDESNDDGFLISDTGIGLRMKAMEYWHCSETGLKSGNAENVSDSIKFVLVESLEGQGLNQVDVFLEDHGGPGVQHIGLYTDDIISTVSFLRQRGTDLVNTPDAYYTGIGKLDEIKEVGISVDVLKENGILLDTEADPGTILDDTSAQSKEGDYPRYLMQKFTKPLFKKRTFFLELIQRVGAQGFGAGNITALWRAVQAYMTYDTKS